MVVLGDLHMEDDMSTHQSARSDITKAIASIPLASSASSSPLAPPPDLDLNAPCGSLTAEQLSQLLSYRRSNPLPALSSPRLVSLGDLGRKDIRHEPGDAGTTLSFELAREYLGGFGLPYDVIAGNHDLEGMDEFPTDGENLEAFAKFFQSDAAAAEGKPYWAREVGGYLLIGLSTERFRDARHSSHEVFLSRAQMDWFEGVLSKTTLTPIVFR